MRGNLRPRHLVTRIAVLTRAHDEVDQSGEAIATAILAVALRATYQASPCRLNSAPTASR